MRRRRALFCLLAPAILLSNVRVSEARDLQSGTSRDAAAIEALRGELVALSPKIDADEAKRIAFIAHETSRRLAWDYGVVGPPLFHNFLVNAGLKKRGLCFQWARDLMDCLAALHLRTLDLHWGAARAGTWREHNCVIVTAHGAPFRTGVVLDAWRHSGRLFAALLTADHYPWKEDLTDCLCARGVRAHRSIAQQVVPTRAKAAPPAQRLTTL